MSRTGNYPFFNWKNIKLSIKSNKEIVKEIKSYAVKNKEYKTKVEIKKI